MTHLDPAPDWMHLLPKDPPVLDMAMADCIAAYQRHETPTHVCRQCISEEMEARIVKAARLAQDGKTPFSEDFGQIYFEHPACVGGEETIKLFLPHGLKTMLTGTPPPGFGKFSYPEVLDTALRAGFWFWSPDLVGTVRALAARLFYDWFTRGHFGLQGWPHSGASSDELMGPGDDIMQLCIACLIDPADLIAHLVEMQTPWADEILTIVGSCTTETPFYLSMEAGRKDGPYKTAADAISASLATREARAALHYVTPAWLHAAFFRHDGVNAELAEYVSKYENYYEIETVGLRKRAGGTVMSDWPDLPVV